MPKERPTIVYKYRGQIERGTGRPGYAWRDGYSPDDNQGRPTYPWLTYRECQANARAQGAKAVFQRD